MKVPAFEAEGKYLPTLFELLEFGHMLRHKPFAAQLDLTFAALVAYPLCYATLALNTHLHANLDAGGSQKVRRRSEQNVVVLLHNPTCIRSWGIFIPHLNY